MSICDVIPSNNLIRTSKLGHYNGWFILAFHIQSCEIPCKSIANAHEFMQIRHCWKNDKLLYQNKKIC